MMEVSPASGFSHHTTSSQRVCILPLADWLADVWVLCDSWSHYHSLKKQTLHGYIHEEMALLLLWSELLFVVSILTDDAFTVTNTGLWQDNYTHK